MQDYQYQPSRWNQSGPSRGNPYYRDRGGGKYQSQQVGRPSMQRGQRSVDGQQSGFDYRRLGPRRDK